MSECPDDRVRRYPPAPPEAGAGAPLPTARGEAKSGAEGTAEPAQVKPNEAKLSPKEKAERIPPPAESGPEAGPAS
jgi:hypothetical protein